MDFGENCIIFVLAKRREPVDAGFLLFFGVKINVFYLRDRKIYLRDKFFFGLGRNFFGPGRIAKLRFRNFFGPEIIKNIKVFQTKNVGF